MSRWPIVLRGLVIAICGILLAIGGCFGFIENMDKAEALAFAGGAAFVIGLLATLSGGVMLVIGVFKWLFSLAAPKQP